VIPGSAKSTRVEYRVGAADANPYLALAAAVGSGLVGHREQDRSGEPIKGNSYEKKHPAKSQLPRTLMEAAGPPQGVEAGARSVRRRLRRSLFGNA
jgi:glutamine synthetase